MRERARIAVVGSGWWATANHLPALRARADVEVAALCDLDASKARQAADHFGVEKIYTDLEAMLMRERLDGVVVATYHAAHYAVARRCLEAGLHSFIEKPMTLYAREARHLVELAERRGAQIVMGYNHNHRRGTLRARECLQNGELGAARYVSAQFSRPVSQLLAGIDKVQIPALHSPGDVYGDPRRSGGGHGQLQLTHLAGMVFFTTGLRVKRVGARMANHGLAVDVTVACHVEYDNDALGAFGGTGHVSGGSQSTRLTVFCEKGWLDLDDTEGVLQIWREGGAPETLESAGAETGYQHGPINNFADVILGKAENLCSGLIGWRAVELLDAAYQSAARDGTAVTLADLYQEETA